jgi:RNA polymerase sigma-70 factor (ECF subfamily)
MNEQDLVARAAAGDMRAFANLVQLHQSRIRGLLRRLTRGDAATADDITQETFLEAFRKISHYRGDGSFAGWLARIAYSRFLMEARKRRLVPILEDGEAFGADEGLGAEAKMDLERAFARLGVSERAALTLHFAMGHSHDEVAQVMNAPLGTVKSLILRGREKLKALLGDWAPEER